MMIAVEFFRQAISNVEPALGLTAMRKGGAVIQIPVPLSPRRRRSMAVKWIIAAARARKGKPMHLRLADELAEAHRSEGNAFKKKIELHKMAEGNRANAQMRWG